MLGGVIALALVIAIAQASHATPRRVSQPSSQMAKGPGWRLTTLSAAWRRTRTSWCWPKLLRFGRLSESRVPLSVRS